MIRVKLDEAKAGMVLSKPIENFQGICLLKQGARLSAENVRILKSWGVEWVWVEGGGKPHEEGSGDFEKNMNISVERRLEKKFSEVLDDAVMAEIMRVASKQIQQRRIKEEFHEDE